MYVIMQINGETGEVLQAAKTEDKQAAAELISELSDRTIENARGNVDDIDISINKHGFGMTDLYQRVGVRIYGIGENSDIDWNKETLDGGLKLEEIPDIRVIPRRMDKASEEKPRPCPMCGCKNITPKASLMENVGNEFYHARFAVTWTISCPDCGCTIPYTMAKYKLDADGDLLTVGGDGRLELIRRWNGKRGGQ